MRWLDMYQQGHRGYPANNISGSVPQYWFLISFSLPHYEVNAWKVGRNERIISRWDLNIEDGPGGGIPRQNPGVEQDLPRIRKGQWSCMVIRRIDTNINETRAVIIDNMMANQWPHCHYDAQLSNQGWPENLSRGARRAKNSPITPELCPEPHRYGVTALRARLYSLKWPTKSKFLYIVMPPSYE